MQGVYEFNSDNYKKEKKIFSRRKANVLLIPLLLVLIFCFVIPFFLIWRVHLDAQIKDLNFWVFEAFLFGSLFGGVIVHEFIHGIVGAFYAKNGFRSIKIGFNKKILTPYCHCKEMLKLKHYILMSIMPCIILGVFPLILGLLIGNIWLLFFGFVFVIAAGRDVYVTKLLWKEDWELWVLDDPKELGCHIYRPLDVH